MAIGTQDSVASGKYDEQYLSEAGTASKFRKEFQGLCNQLKAISLSLGARCPEVSRS